jgi:enamine deaminase RidA (YjgF/YER057c/UK114 family)
MADGTNRRTFLRDGFLLAAGTAGGVLLAGRWPGFAAAIADEKNTAPSAEQRLKELGLELPPPPKPVAVYVPAVRVGNLLFASGHGPARPDGSMIKGKVGGDLSLEQGYAAARQVGLNMLATIRSTVGSLDDVVRVVKVLGMVNCVPTFTDQPKVVNGFSDLMVQIWGERNGKAARSAVGMGSLPSNIPVEVEAIFELRTKA